MHSVDVWVLVDSEGKAVASVDRDDISELYSKNYDDHGLARRLVKVTVKVKVDEQVSASMVVPDEEPVGVE